MNGETLLTIAGCVFTAIAIGIMYIGTIHQ